MNLAEIIFRSTPRLVPGRQSDRRLQHPEGGVRLMFWSGVGFDEPGWNVLGRRFKDASVFYAEPSAITKAGLRPWLKRAKAIQWD
jgi:hypothetical protein